MENNDQSHIPPDDGQISRDIERLLAELGFQGRFISSKAGPWLSLLEFKPDKAVRASELLGLGGDIARMTGRDSVRISVVPKKNTFLFEVAHRKRPRISFKQLSQRDSCQKANGDLPVVFGVDVFGAPLVLDLAHFPCLLMTGMTGSGKSVFLNSALLSLLGRFSPSQCRLALIDTKMLELTVYEGLPHLWMPVALDADDATKMFQSIIQEIDDRYCSLHRCGARNIGQYNARARATPQNKQTSPSIEKEGGSEGKMPFVVVAIDDLADLMGACPNETERFVDKVAKMGSAVGVHLIALTSKIRRIASSYVLEDSFFVRLGFLTRTAEESLQIIGQQGCESLLGCGDALLMCTSGRVARLHGAYASDLEIETTVKFLKTSKIKGRL